MSSDWVEVNEYWRLCVGHLGNFSTTLHTNIWIQIKMTTEIRNVVASLGGSVFSNVSVIIFKQPEDITAFRLIAGV